MTAYYGEIMIEIVGLLGQLGAGSSKTAACVANNVGVLLSRSTIETWRAGAPSGPRAHGIEEDVPGYTRARAEAYRAVLEAQVQRAAGTCPHCGGSLASGKGGA